MTITLNPAAPTPSRTVNDKIMEPVSVVDFGADPTGATDSSAAFQLAIDNAKDIYMPPGEYLIETRLDLTHLSSGGRRIYGSSWSLYGNDDTGSTIIANTGGTLFDCVGSQFLRFHDFNIKATGDNPSVCGFVFARSTNASYQYAQFNSMSNVQCRLETDATAHGGYGTVAVYSVTAELLDIRNCWLRGDTGLAVIKADDFGADSAETIQDNMSNSQITVSGGATVLESTLAAGYCLRLSSVENSRFEDVYFSKLSAHEGAAIYIGGCADVEIRGYCEGPEYIADVGNYNRRCSISGVIELDEDAPFRAISGYVGIEGLTLECHHKAITTANPDVDNFMDGLGGGDVVTGCTLLANWHPRTWLSGGTITNCEYRITDGAVIHSGRSAAPTSGIEYEGSVVYNSNPAESGYLGWVCVQRKDTTASAFSTAAVACTFADTDDLVVKAAHGFSGGETVSFSNITTTTGIVIDTAYYVKAHAAGDFQLEATVDGGVLPLTTDGSGNYRVTLLTVAATTSMLAGDIIGITLDDGTIHWTTIATVVDGTTLRYNKPIAAARSVAANANVYTYRFKGFGAIEA